MTSDSSVGLINLPATDPERIWRQLPSTVLVGFLFVLIVLLGQGCAAIHLGGVDGYRRGWDEPDVTQRLSNNAEVNESRSGTSQ